MSIFRSFTYHPKLSAEATSARDLAMTTFGTSRNTTTRKRPPRAVAWKRQRRYQSIARHRRAMSSFEFINAPRLIRMRISSHCTSRVDRVAGCTWSPANQEGQDETDTEELEPSREGDVPRPTIELAACHGSDNHHKRQR